MKKTLFQTAQQQNFLKSLKEYQKKGAFRINKIEENRKKH